MGLFVKKFALHDSKEDSLYTLTDEDVKRLHKTLLAMYKEIRTACRKHGLHLISCGGTALGAIRHKGFIPWDDDMDLFMMRSEYEVFKTIFDEELGDRYYLLGAGCKDGVNCFFPRIMKKNTTLLDMIDENSPYPHGIYIDLNILEYAPDNDVLRRLKGFGADALRFISYSVYWHQYRSEKLRAFMMNSEGRNYYRLRMLVGKMFSFLPAEKWFEINDRFIQGKVSSKICVPCGAKKYNGEVMDVARVTPFKLVDFEDTTIYITRDEDWYLTNRYGDYMSIPKVEERERHMCIEIDFGEE